MFTVVRGIFQSGLLQTTEIKNDYKTFRLHYTFTVGLLLAFFVIVTTKQFVGEPIECDVTEEGSADLINTYCWIHSTYIIPKAFYKVVGIEVPHPGIDGTQNAREFRFLRYYQWIYFMLFFQAVLFYIPRWLWKVWEAGKMKTLTKDLGDPLLPDLELKEKFGSLTKYLIRTWTAHDAYAVQYTVCEFLALFNVIGQMFLLDTFFGGSFLKYGLRVIEFQLYEAPRLRANSTVDLRGDPMIMMFPRVSKCVFRKYGQSSAIEIYDVLCVMPMNIVNEKIYLFQWFWFVILIVLTSLSLMMDILLIFSVAVRTYTLQTHFHLVDKRDIRILMRKGSFGDWFVIDLIGQNIDNVLLRDIVVELAKALSDNYKLL
ncbi:Innexin shaking-B like protein [Argiope bruennichi]|uniref:Innexin n=2 Tax=Argiope bruennichi TaxID=94029 RepID=A0A8T0FKX9_ARGBR|nr:Innexin shaking-B like protein [Argiope bruennichi]